MNKDDKSENESESLIKQEILSTEDNDIFGSKNFYKGSLASFLEQIGTDKQKGLFEDEVNARLKKYGANSIAESAKMTLLEKVLGQFKDFMVLVLIAASIVSGILGEWVDALVILAIVILNAVMGLIQEGKAEKAIESLRKMSAPGARVIRNGELIEIPASEIVPGDLCVLEAGDIVPADMRLVESSSLKIEEASLTGESVPVEKFSDRDFNLDLPIGDRLNMCYMNTSVTYGRGKGIAIATGEASEIGRIAGSLKTMKEEPTVLQKNLNQLGKILGAVCLVVCGIVFLHGILSGGDLLQVFMTAVSLAVAAIPEGLPAVVTIVLALGMKRMAEKNAIMKKLLAVETLGSVDVICSDKTGTLTQNAMTVIQAWVHNKDLIISGSGYSPDGEISYEDGRKYSTEDDESGVRNLFLSGYLCNDSKITNNSGNFQIIGDPTEGAIKAAGGKAGNSEETVGEYPRVSELPFDSDRKMMTTFNKSPDSEKIVSFTKGAPDIILGGCTHLLSEEGLIELTDLIRKQIMDKNIQMASKALRVLGFAMKEEISEYNFTAEKNMIFIGLMGMIDPERPEAKEAIKVCRSAGIRAVMITGDYLETASAIAKNLGLMDQNDLVMTGSEIEEKSDAEMVDLVEKVAVYARVSPDHKVRIISALKKNGHITSMTGDGVNDALALKRADIGVAMGITGTEVAKNTADMILTDDNFATIVSAVKEGRIIYSNIRKFVGFLLSCNVGEILVIFITSIILGPYFVPLLPIQLLWLNLVTDSFPALALGNERGEPDIMEEKPRSSKERIINRKMLYSIATQSIAIFASVFTAFQIGRIIYPDIVDSLGNTATVPSVQARTFAFVTLICAELLRAFSARSEKVTVFKLGLFSNKYLTYAVLFSFSLIIPIVYLPFLQPIFSTAALTFKDWGYIFMFSSIPFVVGELYKIIAGVFRKKSD